MSKRQDKNASKKRCISPGHIKSVFPNVDPHKLNPQDETLMLVEMKYLSFVKDIVSARSGKQ